MTGTEKDELARLKRELVEKEAENVRLILANNSLLARMEEMREGYEHADA